MMKIRQHVTKLSASIRPNWEKKELAEVVEHAHSLADSLLNDSYDFDDLDDAIAIYEDRPHAAWPRRTDVLLPAECWRRNTDEERQFDGCELRCGDELMFGHYKLAEEPRDENWQARTRHGTTRFVVIKL